MEFYISDARGGDGKGESKWLISLSFVSQIHFVNDVLVEFGKDKIADEDVLQLQKATKILREFYLQTLNVRYLFPSQSLLFCLALGGFHTSYRSDTYHAGTDNIL